MRDTIVKIRDIVGEDIAPQNARDVADYLLACLVHVTNARPLFGVLNTGTEVLEWTAGGAEFHCILSNVTAEDALAMDEGAMSFAQLFTLFGISEAESQGVVVQIQDLPAGASMSLLHPMEGAGDRYFRMVLRRRREPNDAQVQFSLLDITAFQSAALRTKAMAEALVDDLSAPMAGDLPADLPAGLAANLGARDALLGVVDGLGTLFALTSDAEIKALAQDLSTQVTRVSERMVAMLLAFESRYDTSHWQPNDLDPTLRDVIPVHSAPVSSWSELHEQIMIEVEGDPAIRGLDARALKHAYDFVTNAASTLVISPVAGRIFVLNGNRGGQDFATVEDFVRAVGVEENSTRTAVEFFSGLGEAPALGLFAVSGQNVEAWGRPGLYGGWQAMMVPSAGQGVDVRGLFHGLKNLLLHLQVLYVVNTRADVDQVRAGLGEAADKIRGRLAELQAVARTGRRRQMLVRESVGQWLAPLERIGAEAGGGVSVIGDGVGDVHFPAQPGEMEDTLEELVRNAFQHGAARVKVHALVKNNHLCIMIEDDGQNAVEFRAPGGPFQH
ncbi:hypothetical protein ACFL12_04875, partial [Pseudomonadota bacterium]